MKNPPDLLEVLCRSQTGKYCTQKEWDTRRIPQASRAILDRHDLSKTFDPENPINSDAALADAFYRAGFELALQLGYLCLDSERIIQVDEEELRSAIEFAPSALFLGEGKDGTWLRARRPGDPYPIQVCASLAITMSEPMYPLICEWIARERHVDILGGGSLITLRGVEVRSGTPLETLLGFEKSRLHLEIRRRAGRPGMPGNGVYSAVTEYGQFGGFGHDNGFRKSDLALMLFPSEMKIDYRSLHKVVQAKQLGQPLRCDSPSMIGGMPGPAEGAAVCSIACALLSYAILGNDAGGGQIYDVRALANVNREGLWALSITQQALSRNTHLLTHPIANQVSGPGTESLLYEIAAGAVTVASSGGSLTTGPRSAGGKRTDHITPLECRFLGEVAHAACSLQPAQANELVKTLLPRYEANLKAPNLGLPFQKAYNLDTLQPVPEWEAAYRKVRAELIDLGLQL